MGAVTGRLGPRRGKGWGRDIEVPQKRPLGDNPLSLCKEQRRAVRGISEGGFSFPPPSSGGDRGWGFFSVAVGGRLEAWARLGAGAG